MDWFKNIWLNIQKSNDQQYKNTIKSLRQELIKVNKQVSINIKEIEEVQTINDLLYETINKQSKQLQDKSKHNSLEMYKWWLINNTKTVIKKYNYDGNGSKDVTTIFSKSLKHEELIRDFTKTDMNFDGSKYKTSDKLIYYFNKYFSIKFPTNKYYEHDKNNWGRIEYWATVNKIIIKFRTKKRKADDCDGFMTLKYCMLYYLLKDYFPQDLWRLRGFIVDIWTGGGHALLAWVKEGVNDWIPIETTFYDTKFVKVWNKNYCIRNQMLYQIRYSFDNKHAYIKI